MVVKLSWWSNMRQPSLCHPPWPPAWLKFQQADTASEPRANRRRVTLTGVFRTRGVMPSDAKYTVGVKHFKFSVCFLTMCPCWLEELTFCQVRVYHYACNITTHLSWPWWQVWLHFSSALHQQVGRSCQWMEKTCHCGSQVGGACRLCPLAVQEVQPQ